MTDIVGMWFVLAITSEIMTAEHLFCSLGTGNVPLLGHNLLAKVFDISMSTFITCRGDR